MVGKRLLVLAVLAPLGGWAEERVVYESKWEKPSDPIGKEWKTNGQVEISPNGKRVFLAQIGTKGAAFRLGDLPSHQLVKFECDLILRGSWDGLQEIAPDKVTMVLGDGRVILDAAFQAYDWPNRAEASYPYDASSEMKTPPRTGAAEVSTLGYYLTNLKFDQVPADAVYPFVTFLAHREDTFSLQVVTQLTDDRYQDQWVGLDNVKISILTEPVEYSDADWAKLEDALAGEDAMAAFRASGKMLGAPDRLKAARPPKAVVGEAKLARLIKDLGDADFEVRRAATKELLEAPPGAVGELKAAHAELKDDKVARTVQKIIDVLAQSGGVDGAAYWRERLKGLSTVPKTELKKRAPKKHDP